jgi:hypothetical protein
MRRRQPIPSSFSSSSNSNRSDIESCFDTEDEQEETDAGTELTDVDTDIDRDNEADLVWIARDDNAYLPEYYLNQENDSDKSEDKGEDYSDGSILLFDRIEAQFH